VPSCNNKPTIPGNLSPSFLKKLNTAQQKYSVYDRELLAIYEAVRHFRYMLEARQFTILTDHKPLIYTFQQKRDNAPPVSSTAWI
jgi:cleavage and polyadenylation specificity factor subunit 1